MKFLRFVAGICLPLFVPALALAAPGEYWQVTTSMEMAGMPMVMPPTTIKVCIAKGGESDPRQSADKDCVLTDLRSSGNKTSWKIRCVKDGEVMEGSGEMSGTANKTEGVIRMKGNSGGRPYDITQRITNERMGGACNDTEEANDIGAAARSAACKAGDGDLITQVSNASLLLNEKTCPGRKQPLCNALRSNIGRDVDVFSMVMRMESGAKPQIASACGLNLAAATQTICAKVSAANVGQLAAYCPTQAKRLREDERRRDCEGRSFTGRQSMAQCLAGQDVNGGDDGPSEAPAATGFRKQVPANRPPAATPMPTEPVQPQPANPADALMDGAKKLKGLFGL